jgi:hypothetical protein
MEKTREDKRRQEKTRWEHNTPEEKETSGMAEVDKWT